MSRIQFINNKNGNKVSKIEIPNNNGKYSVVLALAIIPETGLSFSLDYPRNFFIKKQNKWNSGWQVDGHIRQTETLEEARDYVLAYVDTFYKYAKMNIEKK